MKNKNQFLLEFPAFDVSLQKKEELRKPLCRALSSAWGQYLSIPDQTEPETPPKGSEKVLETASCWNGVPRGVLELFGNGKGEGQS